ncbi:MAG: CsbD family protein [Gammaproteobacteria bacterium]|nr:CsbD family protein [Gammaproteobacteria bacterium]
MNRDIIEGRWKQLKGKARMQWCQLTGDHLGAIAGQRTQNAGRLQVAVGEGLAGKRYKRPGVSGKG